MIINKLIARFTDPVTPQLIDFISGVHEPGGQGAIDDGEYGDPTRDTRPDFVQKDNQGWV